MRALCLPLLPLYFGGESLQRKTCFTANQSQRSLPGAIGMYGLSLGVQQMDDVLPGAVYALLSGLNASTVGVIALAAVQV